MGIWGTGRVGGFWDGGRLLLGELCELFWSGPGGGGLDGLRGGRGAVQGEERTPLRVAFEARLALALCLPPMGAVRKIVSEYSLGMF